MLKTHAKRARFCAVNQSISQDTISSTIMPNSDSSSDSDASESGSEEIRNDTLLDINSVEVDAEWTVLTNGNPLAADRSDDSPLALADTAVLSMETTNDKGKVTTEFWRCAVVKLERGTTYKQIDLDDEQKMVNAVIQATPACKTTWVRMAGMTLGNTYAKNRTALESTLFGEGCCVSTALAKRWKTEHAAKLREEKKQKKKASEESAAPKPPAATPAVKRKAEPTPAPATRVETPPKKVKVSKEAAPVAPPTYTLTVTTTSAVALAAIMNGVATVQEATA